MRRFSLIVFAPLFAASACTLDFDASKIPIVSHGDGGPAQDVRDPSTFDEGGVDGLGQNLSPLVMWTFASVGSGGVILDRGAAGLHADLFAVQNSDVGHGDVTNGAWLSTGGVLRSDPGPATAAVAAIVRSGAISLEVWCEVDPATAYKGSVLGTEADFARISQTKIGTEMNLDTTADTTNSVVSLLDPLRLRHVVATFANDTGVERLYIDGDEAATLDLRSPNTAHPTLIPPVGESRLQIGDATWNGKIYLAAVYDHVLQAADVRALYAAGSMRAP